MEYNPHMQIVQIVLDKQLLQAADQAAKRTRKNRSALVREALRALIERESARRLARLGGSEPDLEAPPRRGTAST